MNALQRAIAHPQPTRAFNARSPMHGLDRHSVGFVDVLAQSLAAVAPSAAASTITLLVAGIAGGGTIYAMAAGTVLALLIASSINQFTRRLAGTGSLYTLVSRAFHPTVAGTAATLTTGAAMLVGYGFVAMFALTGSAYYLNFFIQFLRSSSSSPWLVVLLVFALASGLLMVLVGGIRLSARVAMVIEAASVVIILGLIVILLVRIGTVDFSVFAFASVTPTNLAIGAVLAVTAYLGFESSATLGVEAKRPLRSIPRAITWTVLGSGLLFLLVSYSQIAGFNALGRDLAASPAGLAELSTAFDLPWVGPLLDVGIAASFFACAIASTTALARVLFAMGREGLLPARFGSTHSVYRTPAAAIVWAVPVIAAVPVVAVLTAGGLWQAMEILIIGAAGGFITAYVLVCVATPVFLHRIGESTVWPAARAISAAIVLSIALLVYLASELTGIRSGGVWLFLAAMTAILVVLLVRRVRRPWLSSRMGIYDEPVAADVLGARLDPDDAPHTW
jgi:amino acid transporter